MAWTSILLSLAGLIGGLVSIKFILISHYRVNRSIGAPLYKKLLSDSTFKFTIVEELVIDKKDPSIFKGIFNINSIFIMFDKNERLLTAGWTPKEYVIDIYFLGGIVIR